MQYMMALQAGNYYNTVVGAQFAAVLANVIWCISWNSQANGFMRAAVEQASRSQSASCDILRHAGVRDTVPTAV